MRGVLMGPGGRLEKDGPAGFPKEIEGGGEGESLSLGRGGGGASTGVATVHI